jgi:LysM domain
MRTTTFRSDWLVALLAGALVAPALLGAQPAATRTRSHVVKAGETLWRIAQDSLGDGHRWTEILALNRDHVTSPNQLETGLRLVLPARARSSAPTRRPSAPMKAAARGDTNRASAPPNAGAQRPLAVSKPAAPPAGGGARKRVAVEKPAPPRAAVEHPVVMATVSPSRGAPTSAGRSIFFSKEPGAAPPSAMSLGADTIGTELAPPAPVRAWEYVSAPFVAPEDALRDAGRCVGLRASQGTLTAASSVVRFGDRMTLTPPAGATASPGDRFLVARVGPELRHLGPILIPTGIVRVDSGAHGNVLAVAQVLSQFATLSCDDRILPLELPAETVAANTMPVSGGATGEVLWVGGSALLPSLQYNLIVNLGSGAVRPGDQIALLGETSDSAGMPPTQVAVAAVLRVGPRTSTAEIIRRSRGDIAPGTPVRVSAKLP